MKELSSESVELLVTPEQMYAAAGLIEKKISTSQTAFDGMLEDIKRTSGYWEGEAAEKERQRFDKERGNFDTLINNLTNYVKELKIITGIYEACEETSVLDSESLPSDVLS